jgi:hypothetical protein
MLMKTKMGAKRYKRIGNGERTSNGLRRDRDNENPEPTKESTEKMIGMTFSMGETEDVPVVGCRMRFDVAFTYEVVDIGSCFDELSGNG